MDGGLPKSGAAGPVRGGYRTGGVSIETTVRQGYVSAARQDGGGLTVR